MCSQKHQSPRRAKLTTQRYCCHPHILPTDLQLSLHACLTAASLGHLCTHIAAGVMALLPLIQGNNHSIAELRRCRMQRPQRTTAAMVAPD